MPHATTPTPPRPRTVGTSAGSARASSARRRSRRSSRRRSARSATRSSSRMTAPTCSSCPTRSPASPTPSRRPRSRAPRSRSGTRSRRPTSTSPATRRSPAPPPDRGVARTMLDALLAEARLRWRLDPAAGLALVVAERLVATPVEPTVPLLIVPASRVRGSVDASTVVPLPGRHGHGAADPVAVLRRLYPADHHVGRFGVPEDTTVGALTDADLLAPLYLAPVVPVADVASPWGMPWLSARLREPD